MEQIQNIELEDMMSIIHGLKMNGFAFVEPDALDAINDRIRNLPSSEALSSVYSDPREVKRLCAEIGRIMELIDYYGVKNEEYKARHKAKTKLPPRYKNMKYEKARSNMGINKIAQEIPDASSEMEAMSQQTRDISSQLQQTQSDLQNFSTRINQDLPVLQSQMPKNVQSVFQQYSMVVIDATNRLLETSNILLSNVNSFQQSTEGINQILQQSQEQVKTFMSNTTAGYIGDIIKLSSNLEGNGIISDKMITYARNLRDKSPQSIYDAREIDLLLRHANLEREANTLVKTAVWYNPATWGKGDKSSAPETSNSITGPANEYQGQTGDQWQTGDIETQFSNDIDWLKRSWDNLVDFFGRYNKDAETLVEEWNGKGDEAKVNKIKELKSQADIMLEKALEIQNSNNFTSTESYEGSFFNSNKINSLEETKTTKEKEPAPLNEAFKKLKSNKSGKDLTPEEIDSILVYLKGNTVTSKAIYRIIKSAQGNVELTDKEKILALGYIEKMTSNLQLSEYEKRVLMIYFSNLKNEKLPEEVPNEEVPNKEVPNEEVPNENEIEVPQDIRSVFEFALEGGDLKVENIDQVLNYLNSISSLFKNARLDSRRIVIAALPRNRSGKGFKPKTQPTTPQPTTPQPTTPQPTTPQPATPQPATPQPATPQPENKETVIYINDVIKSFLNGGEVNNSDVQNLIKYFTKLKNNKTKYDPKIANYNSYKSAIDSMKNISLNVLESIIENPSKSTLEQDPEKTKKLYYLLGLIEDYSDGKPFSDTDYSKSLPKSNLANFNYNLKKLAASNVDLQIIKEFKEALMNGSFDKVNNIKDVIRSLNNILLPNQNNSEVTQDQKDAIQTPQSQSDEPIPDSTSLKQRQQDAIQTQQQQANTYNLFRRLSSNKNKLRNKKSV